MTAFGAYQTFASKRRFRLIEAVGYGRHFFNLWPEPQGQGALH